MNRPASPVCLGTQHMGESQPDEGACRALLDAYLARGGTLLDTAPDFADGRAQAIVGRWLATKPGRPLSVSSKFGFTRSGIRSDASAMRDAARRGRDALGLDHFDLLWCQGWDGVTPLDAVVDALADAVAAGLTRAVALTDWPAWAAAAVVALARSTGRPVPVAVQLEYSILAREVECDLLPLARASGLWPLAWGVTAGGALAGRPVAAGSYYRHALGPGWQGTRERLGRLARARGQTPAQLAVGWVVAHGAVANVGPQTAEALEDMWPPAALDAEALAALDALHPPPARFPQRYWSALYAR